MNKKRIISVIVFFVLIAIVLIFSAINYKRGKNNENINNAKTTSVVEENSVANNTENNVTTQESEELNNTTNTIQENSTAQSQTQENQTPQTKPQTQSQTNSSQQQKKEETKPTVPNPYNLDTSVFVLDIPNYNPTSSEVKISESKARSIAQKGFEESKKRIAGEGADDKASETVKIETISPNNYFTRQGREHDKIYTNKKRKCYIITRENDMGNGIKIYVDVTTGLIIGGSAFGD